MNFFWDLLRNLEVHDWVVPGGKMWKGVESGQRLDKVAILSQSDKFHNSTTGSMHFCAQMAKFISSQFILIAQQQVSQER